MAFIGKPENLPHRRARLAKLDTQQGVQDLRELVIELVEENETLREVNDAQAQEISDLQELVLGNIEQEGE